MLPNDLVGPTGDMLDGGALPQVNPHPQGPRSNFESGGADK